MDKPPPRLPHKLWIACMALVWLVNGLWCKLFNGVPRHRSIVSEIVSAQHATLITQGIGVLEILMAVWIISGYRARLNACVQIAAVAVMNILEAVLTPHLLLFGRWNAAVAAVFIALIILHEWTRPQHTPAVKAAS